LRKSNAFCRLSRTKKTPDSLYSLSKGETNLTAAIRLSISLFAASAYLALPTYKNNAFKL